MVRTESTEGSWEIGVNRVTEVRLVLLVQSAVGGFCFLDLFCNLCTVIRKGAVLGTAGRSCDWKLVHFLSHIQYKHISFLNSLNNFCYVAHSFVLFFLGFLKAHMPCIAFQDNLKI